jgi:hypothetical protein
VEVMRQIIMNKHIIFIVLITIIVVFALLNNYIFVSDDLYFNSLGEQLSYEKIEKILNQNKKWGWVGYVFIPIIIYIKLALVAGCLSIGALFISKRFEFKKMWGVALEAEFVFLIPSILKILWFAFIQTDYTLKDLQLFYPLSLLNFFNVRNVEPWLLYPLQVFNVFEVVYWLLLARGIQMQPLNRTVEPPPKGTFTNDNEMSFGAALQLVLVSYGSWLLVWVALVMFLTLSYS